MKKELIEAKTELDRLIKRNESVKQAETNEKRVWVLSIHVTQKLSDYRATF